MSQSNSFLSRSTTPSKLHQPIPTKVQILQWIQGLLPLCDESLTIESLGNGEVYCRIINHYLPGTILPSRIISRPVNEYERCLNLKQVQIGLCKLRLNIPFDINKICKQRFNENWNLAVMVYRNFQEINSRKAWSQGKTPTKLHQQPDLKEKVIQSDLKDRKILEENYSRLNEKIGKTVQPQREGLVYVVDRVKEILISNANDTYKILLIRKLFGVEEVKVEQNCREFFKQFLTGQQMIKH